MFQTHPIQKLSRTLDALDIQKFSPYGVLKFDPVEERKYARHHRELNRKSFMRVYYNTILALFYSIANIPMYVVDDRGAFVINFLSYPHKKIGSVKQSTGFARRLLTNVLSYIIPDGHTGAIVKIVGNSASGILSNSCLKRSTVQGFNAFNFSITPSPHFKNYTDDFLYTTSRHNVVSVPTVESIHKKNYTHTTGALFFKSLDVSIHKMITGVVNPKRYAWGNKRREESRLMKQELMENLPQASELADKLLKVLVERRCIRHRIPRRANRVRFSIY